MRSYASVPPMGRALSKFTVTDACWQWDAADNGEGYGAIGSGGHNGRLLLAHRVVYEALVGPIPDGLTIDHLCRNRRCVRPSHLEAVAENVNLMRGMGPAAINARKTSCNRGHPFDSVNTYVEPRGKRHCRTCGRESRRKRYAA